MNWPLFQNSLVVAGSVTALASLAGFVAALTLAVLPGRWKRAGLLLTAAPLLLPPFLSVDCWLRYLGNTGAWRPWIPFDIYSLGGTVWILTLALWPISALIVAAAWSKLDKTQLEAEPALTRFALIRHLLWPQARPALGLGAAIIFVLALNNFSIPSILQVKVLPAELWIRFNTRLEQAELWPVVWPLLIAPVVLLLLARRSLVSWPRVEGAPASVAFRRQLAGWNYGAGLGTLLLLLLTLVLPLQQVLANAGTWSQLPRAADAGAGALWNSFFFSFIAASAGTLLALGTRRWRVGPFFWLPFLAPGILLGLGFIEIFNRPGWQFLSEGGGLVMAALALRYLAIPWTAIRQSFAAVDMDLVEAGRIETSSRWQLWRHSYWPQMASQVAAAWYLIYLLSLWDVETILLLVPPGGETVALRVFNLLHYGHTSDVNALGLLLLLVGLAPWLAWRGVSLFRTALPSMLLLLTLACGCSPQPEANTLPHSRFFERIQIIGIRGTGAGQFNKPRSVAVDTNDNLYVVDMTGRVQRFSPDGQYLSSWQMPETDKGKPKGMICDGAGNIVVLEPHYSRVNHYSAAGQLVAQWGKHGTNGGLLAFPRSLAVNSRGDIYVSEYGLTERIQCFTALGQKWLWQTGQPGTGRGEFNRPEGLGIDGQDRLYVADSCNHRIQILSSSGTALGSFGQAGVGPGEFSYPYDVRIDRAGYLFVCEFGNNRLQVFSPDHKPLEVIGHAGASPGTFNNPWSIALDSHGNLYVADANNHRVQKLMRRPQSLPAQAPVPGKEITPAQRRPGRDLAQERAAR